ncbi:uncharacterized protein ARMOST_08451 [Armillaria ostoyae]|uniref:HNH nuclease domain-containing protein n=1 Tax=Armillaria ostoyae TaxID=47428 RepID=A0A284R8P8_ARMOS|nr:uncharacterized protein ARMOST_08451 [Armillaria ostoyae]
MAVNSVSDDVVQYVSNAPVQAGVTPEEYRDTLRAHCKDHWDWSPIVNFAHEYFSHLGLAMYNPSGRVVPAESSDESPHFQSVKEIEAILERFGTPGHSGQKEKIKLAHERDGEKCLVTNLLFETPGPLQVGTIVVPAELAHICPTKLTNHENPFVYQAFWDDAEFTKRFETLVNSPENCLLLSHYPHRDLDQMGWAIEAIENVDQDTWDYYFVKFGRLSFPSEPANRTRIKFGVEGGPFKSAIPMPSPFLCNLRLAITKVMRLSGAAEVVESWKDDYNDGPKAISGVLGHPYTDMVAMGRLDAQLGSSIYS